MTAKYGIKTEWWKHLKHTKRPHWKAVRRLFKNLIRRDKDGGSGCKWKEDDENF